MRKILVANRGEIACRIARTVRAMGLQVATVHSTADAQSLHVRDIGESVCIGAAEARASYLDIAAVIAAARQVGADAIHPGFGFLSENAAFAEACAEANLTFIGPAPEVLALFGDKAAAKRLARRLEIPTAGGIDEPSDDVDALLQAAADLPLPYILKAVAGGGGKGMRVVRERGQARAAIEAAIREGRSSFGDGRLIAERYVPAARHIEVQILGDGTGEVIHLFDRECSLQRRYQKVVEEAPVTSLPTALREQLWAQAVALGRATRYLGLGTVEFAVTGGSAVFLEVNPRLQVEHPVTEAMLGLDLVALQIQAVAQGRLPMLQADVPATRGVAMQARLYAEDPAQGFIPSTGRVAVFEPPPGLRVDTGIDSGSEITSHYDPMVAKLIAHGATRQEALQRLRAGLAATTLLGVASNRGFLAELLADEAVQRNEVTTEFIEQWLAGRAPRAPQPRQVAALAALWLANQRGRALSAGAWGDAALTGWRLARGDLPAPAPTHRATSTGQAWQIGFGPSRAPGRYEVLVDGVRFDVDASSVDGRQSVSVDGLHLDLRSHVDANGACAAWGKSDLALELRPMHTATGGSAAAQHGIVRAPMMGLVIAVDVREGEQVTAGQRLGIMESMKMEMTLTAPVAGRVTAVGCAAQARVERHQELFRIEGD